MGVRIRRRGTKNSPSPCGRGLGGGVVHATSSRRDPSPSPLPQGEGEYSSPAPSYPDAYGAKPLDPTKGRALASLRHPRRMRMSRPYPPGRGVFRQHVQPDVAPLAEPPIAEVVVIHPAAGRGIFTSVAILMPRCKRTEQARNRRDTSGDRAVLPVDRQRAAGTCDTTASARPRTWKFQSSEPALTTSMSPPHAAGRTTAHSIARASVASISGRQGEPSLSTVISAVAHATKSLKSSRSRSDMPQVGGEAQAGDGHPITSSIPQPPRWRSSNRA